MVSVFHFIIVSHPTSCIFSCLNTGQGSNVVRQESNIHFKAHPSKIKESKKTNYTSLFLKEKRKLFGGKKKKVMAVSSEDYIWNRFKVYMCIQNIHNGCQMLCGVEGNWCVSLFVCAGEEDCFSNRSPLMICLVWGWMGEGGWVLLDGNLSQWSNSAAAALYTLRSKWCER